MSSQFGNRYNTILTSLGPPAARKSHELIGTMPAWLPRALAYLYSVAGEHRMNHVHNRLLLPRELNREGGKNRFAEENQEVVALA